MHNKKLKSKHGANSKSKYEKTDEDSLLEDA